MTAPVLISQKDDLGAVLALIQSSFAEQEGVIDPPSSMNRLQVLDIYQHLETGVVWGSYDEARLVGCLFGAPKQDALYLSKLSVRPEMRGRGLAGQLMAGAESYAATTGYVWSEVIARVELVQNHAMFERLGYAKFAEGRHDGYDRTTEFHFRKPVNTVGAP